MNAKKGKKGKTMLNATSQKKSAKVLTETQSHDWQERAHW